MMLAYTIRGVAEAIVPKSSLCLAAVFAVPDC